MWSVFRRDKEGEANNTPTPRMALTRLARIAAPCD
jgi:hypothetical protein